MLIIMALKQPIYVSYSYLPLPEPIVTYGQLDKIQGLFLWKTIYSKKKCIWKCHFQNVVQAPMR